MKFIEEDNIQYKWTQEKNQIKAVIPYQKDTLLEPGESATVEIVLTWINDENNLEVKINVAEISEDDIDSAMVMLAVRIGEKTQITYIAIVLGFIIIVSIAVITIKKSVISK